MRNMKMILTLVLALCLTLSLCACGEAAAEPTQPQTVPTTTPQPTETTAPAQEGGYTVKVVDENGNPIAGAMVQLCKDACVPGQTDDQGVAKFNLPEDTYKVSFLMLPAGYDYVDETQEFYFEDGSMELTITLKAAA